MGEGYTVKIWYRSGAFERVSDVPPQDASLIFGDASVDPRVDTVELHGPTGLLLDHVRH